MEIRKAFSLLLASVAISLATNVLSVHTIGIHTAYAQAAINDPNLRAELISSGMSFPTSMAFLDNNNILVLEKEGAVRLITNGVMQDSPVLQVTTDSKNERGLLGIAISGINGNATSSTASGQPSTVFLYYTEQGEEELRNRVYKYQWNGQSLVNPVLLLDLPAGPGTNHQGGKMVVGPDGYLYVVIGELQREGQLQNIENGPPPDDSGVIFRINTEDGSAAPDNPFQDDATNRYFAYGVRNSFGLAFDPVTGVLWDTENGEDSYDEINIVDPGFNSGWKTVMGPISRAGVSEESLVQIPGSQYYDPIFSWIESFGITDIEFFNSDSLGQKYANNIFAGDITQGNLYFFEVNQDRNGLQFNPQSQSGLSDLVADTDEEVSSVTLGTGFVGITDIETGPDGLLYVLTHDRETGEGDLYKISSAAQ
ncbi:MAG TPA: PQQ-dependent sugar dehydrogenase [Nitrososphaeraceae archaeon]|nr:PQQ-dependent sugar dehydrogenase [Nitrososphaeraceae archaeon]